MATNTSQTNMDKGRRDESIDRNKQSMGNRDRNSKDIKDKQTIGKPYGKDSLVNKKVPTEEEEGEEGEQEMEEDTTFSRGTSSQSKGSAQFKGKSSYGSGTQAQAYEPEEPEEEEQ